jgi:hypothetical protein
MPETFETWHEIERFRGEVQGTQVYRDNISSVRHPIGMLMTILQREMDAPREYTWPSQTARGVAEQIRELVGAPKLKPVAQVEHQSEPVIVPLGGPEAVAA